MGQLIKVPYLSPARGTQARVPESPTVESQFGLCLAASDMTQWFHSCYIRGSWGEGELTGAKGAGRGWKLCLELKPLGR